MTSQPEQARAMPKSRSKRISGSLGCGPTAVHAEVGPGDRSSLLAAQEHRQRGDFLGRDEALGWLRGEQNVVHHLLAGETAGLHRVRYLALDQGRPDITRRDAIDGDAVTRRL